MKKALILTLVASFIAFAAFSPTLFAAPPADKGKPGSGGGGSDGGGGGKTSDPLGIDVSWPQCDTKLPTDFAFAIVGINNGYANQPNECLDEQMAWAQGAAGGTTQEKVQVYVNTANPSEYIGTEWLDEWPENNTIAGETIANPYGECDDTASQACEWMYGYTRAFYDVRFLVDAYPAADPASLIWWLDVETDNSWRMGGTAADKQGNLAVLEGMTTYFNAIGAQVGIYAYGPQWRSIIGEVLTADSNIAGLPNWRPGGAGLATATQACTAESLTLTGDVVLTQFVKRGLDYNYSCNG